MQIVCEGCGVTFEAKRKSRRFCGDTCQKRAKRGNVISIDRKRAPSPSSGSVSASTLDELTKLDVVDSMLGQTALALALRIDVGNESGAATAALAKELRATFEAIEARVPQPEGTVSSLRLKLLERSQGA